MEEDKLNIDETTFSVDLSEATDAVKEGSFEYALNLLEIILKDHPDHIDSLYLAAVSTRYLRKFDDSKQYIEHLEGYYWVDSYYIIKELDVEYIKECKDEIIKQGILQKIYNNS